MFSTLLFAWLLAAQADPVIKDETAASESSKPSQSIPAKKPSAKAPKALLYRWRDANGRIVISDTPPKHGKYEVIEVPQAQTYRAPSLQPLEPLTTGTESGLDKDAAPPVPDIEIVSPPHDSWLDNNTGKADIRIRLTGNLPKQYQLEVYLDGKPLGHVTQYTLDNLDRGAHQLRVIIRDVQKRKTVKEKTSTFYVRRPSIHQPTGPYPKAGPPMPAHLQRGKNPYQPMHQN